MSYTEQCSSFTVKHSPSKNVFVSFAQPLSHSVPAAKEPQGKVMYKLTEKRHWSCSNKRFGEVILKQKIAPFTKTKMLCKNQFDFTWDFSRKVCEVQRGLTCACQWKGRMCNQSRPWSWGLSFILQKTWKDYLSCQCKSISKLRNVVTRHSCSFTSRSIIREVWVWFIFPFQVVQLIVQAITTIMPPVSAYFKNKTLYMAWTWNMACMNLLG